MVLVRGSAIYLTCLTLSLINPAHAQNCKALFGVPESNSDVKFAQRLARNLSQPLGSSGLNPIGLAHAKKLPLGLDRYRKLHNDILRIMATQEGLSQNQTIADHFQLTLDEAADLKTFVQELDLIAVQDPKSRQLPDFLKEPNQTLRLSPQQRQLIKYVKSVVGSRARYLTVLESQDQDILKIASPVGEYTIRVDGKATVVEKAPSKVKIADHNGRWIVSDILIRSDSSDPRGRIRQGLRADQYLHPGMRPPSLAKYNLPSELTEIQLEAVKELIKMDQEQQAKKQPVALGLMMPTGTGKTLTIAHYVKWVEEHLAHRKGRIVVIVESNQILEQTEKAYFRELGIEPNKVVKLYGGRRFNADEFNDPNKRLFLVTRSSYIDKKDEFDKLFSRESKRSPQDRMPFYFVIDEAHHTGTEDGEFEIICEHIQENALPGDRLVMTSATLWHEDSNIIREYLKGQVYGPLLNAVELQQLRQGLDPRRFAIHQWLRAIQQGWCKPIAQLHLLNYEGPESLQSLLKTKIDKQQGVRRIEIHVPLYRALADLIKRTRVPGVYDRGFIFEPTIPLTEHGSRLLTNLLDAEVKPLHSAAKGPKHASKVIEWLDDKCRRPGGEIDNTDLQTHKYTSCVDIPLEGLDVISANFEAFLRNPTTSRVVIQSVGRGTRVAPFNPDLRIIDIFGTVLRTLQGILLDENEFDDSGVRLDLKTEVVLDNDTVDEDKIQVRSVDPSAIIAQTLLKADRFLWAESERLSEFKSDLKYLFEGWHDLEDFGPLENVNAVLNALINGYPKEKMRGGMPMKIRSKVQREVKAILARTNGSDPELQLLYGLFVIAQHWNDLPLRERLGLKKIDLAKIGNILEIERLLAGLWPVRETFTLEQDKWLGRKRLDKLASERLPFLNARRLHAVRTKHNQPFRWSSFILSPHSSLNSYMPPAARDNLVEATEDKEQFKTMSETDWLLYVDYFEVLQFNWLLREYPDLFGDIKPLDPNAFFDVQSDKSEEDDFSPPTPDGYIENVSKVKSILDQNPNSKKPRKPGRRKGPGSPNIGPQNR